MSLFKRLCKGVRQVVREVRKTVVVIVDSARAVMVTLTGLAVAFVALLEAARA